MNLKTRLILLVVSLITVTVLAVSIALTWGARKRIAEQTERDGLVIAQLLARGAGVLDNLPEDVEEIIGKQMVVQAMFASHMIAMAENFIPNKDQGVQEVLKRLKNITEQSDLAEVTITDSRGFAYIQTSPTPLSMIFEPNTSNPSSQFYELLSGERSQLVQKSYRREIDDKLYKYSGVSGVDQPRIVQVGYDLSFLNALKQRVGFQRLVEGLLAGESVNAIWIVNKSLETLAFGTSKSYKTNSTSPSELELDYLEKVVKNGSVFSLFHEGMLKVMAPVFGKNNQISGATVIQLPIHHLQATINDQLKISLIVAIIAIMMGLIITYFLAQWLSHPVNEITNVAANVEKGKFYLDYLDNIALREDELGQLARVFQTMGREIYKREERLDALVKVRTLALEGTTKNLKLAFEQLKQTQHQLVEKEKMASLGQLTSGIAHELKNPLNFVINFSNVTVDIAQDLQTDLETIKDKLKSEEFDLLCDYIKDISQNCNKIYEHGKNAEYIINTMIQHANNKTIQKDKVQFNEFVTEQVKVFEKLITENPNNPPCKITLELDNKIDYVDIAREGLKRVLANLLDNAYYAIREKYELNHNNKPPYEPYINITTTNVENQVKMVLKDNGTGIEESLLDKIFNPLFTTKPTRKGNTGMGLSISYDIIAQQHQGTIQVLSRKNEWTQFTITLPIKEPLQNDKD